MGRRGTRASCVSPASPRRWQWRPGHRAQGCWLPAPGHGTSVTARASLFSSPHPLRGPQPSAHPHRNPIPTGTEDSSSVGTSSVQPLGDVSCQSPVLKPALLALLGRQPHLPEGGSVTSVATATPPPGSPQSQEARAWGCSKSRCGQALPALWPHERPAPGADSGTSYGAGHKGIANEPEPRPHSASDSRVRRESSLHTVCSSHPHWPWPHSSKATAPGGKAQTRASANFCVSNGSFCFTKLTLLSGFSGAPGPGWLQGTDTCSQDLKVPYLQTAALRRGLAQPWRRRAGPWEGSVAPLCHCGGGRVARSGASSSKNICPASMAMSRAATPKRRP